MPAIYFTGHEIADRVASSFVKLGYTPYDVRTTQEHPNQCHVGYGILRGMTDIFRRTQIRKERFIFVDKGFLNPNHYDGYYRLGVNTFQQPYEPHAFGTERLEKILGKEKPFTPMQRGEYILVCPPTDHIAQFYGMGVPRIWLQNVLPDIVDNTDRPIKVRFKTDKRPLEEDLAKAYCVVTHSSGVSWRAARYGIPAITDSKCVLHNWNQLELKDIENSSKMSLRESDAIRLLSFLSAYQFTLKEIESGAAKHIVEGK